MLMKLKMGLVALVALLVLPSSAFALVGPKHVDGQLRVSDYTISNVIIPTTATSTDTGGVLLNQQLWLTGTIQSRTIRAPNIGTIPYPTRLKIDLVDGGAGGTLLCTLTIVGKNQFGVMQRETYAATETEGFSAYVYEQLDSIAISGCTGPADATDFAHVTTSRWVGLPRKLRVAGDIISMCFDDTSASAARICYRGSGTVSGTRVSLDEAGAVSVPLSAVNIADSDLTTVLVNGDRALTFRIRAFDPPNL